MLKISAGDIAHIVVSVFAPAAALAVAFAVRSGLGQGHSTRVLLDVVVVGAMLWLAASLLRSATRPIRDQRAARRLAALRAECRLPDRTLVLLQTSVRVASAGQHAVVVQLKTGERHFLWLPECDAPIGSFVLVELRERQAVVTTWLGPRSVESAHRFERRRESMRLSERGTGAVARAGRRPAARDQVTWPVTRAKQVIVRDEDSGIVAQVETFLRQHQAGQ